GEAVADLGLMAPAERVTAGGECRLIGPVTHECEFTFLDGRVLDDELGVSDRAIQEHRGKDSKQQRIEHGPPRHVHFSFEPPRGITPSMSIFIQYCGCLEAIRMTIGVETRLSRNFHGRMLHFGNASSAAHCNSTLATLHKLPVQARTKANQGKP